MGRVGKNGLGRVGQNKNHLATFDLFIGSQFRFVCDTRVIDEWMMFVNRQKIWEEGVG